MLVVTWLLLSMLFVAFCFQVIWAWQLIVLYRRARTQQRNLSYLPKAAVVMTLRGADPFLNRTLNSLLQLDYPDFEIRIVVDHKDDPAWKMVHEFAEQSHSQRIHLEVLQKRLTTCSLRMSSLIQAVGGLDDSFEVVVIVDADAIAYPDWLRDLVAPLSDPKVGAACGIRWFMPDVPNMGSLVRHIWNAAAFCQMHSFGIGWGGSLAVRKPLLNQVSILEKWSNIMFEDTFTVNEIQMAGSKLKFVPAATMVNREFIDLKGCIKFITRQLLNARLYHNSWPFVIAYALLLAVALNGTVAAAAVAWALSYNVQTLMLLCGLLVYLIGIVSVMAWGEFEVRQVLRRRQEPLTPVSWNLLAAGLVTNVVYLLSIAMALRVKNIEWRGVRYVLGGARQVSLEHYSPFQPVLLETQNTRSSL